MKPGLTFQLVRRSEIILANPVIHHTVNWKRKIYDPLTTLNQAPRLNVTQHSISQLLLNEMTLFSLLGGNKISLYRVNKDFMAENIMGTADPPYTLIHFIRPSEHLKAMCL